MILNFRVMVSSKFSDVSEVKNDIKSVEQDQSEDQLRGFNTNCAGYGIVPKLVMQGRNLSITSKAIYAYFCSYTGAGNTCFPSRQKICYDLGISKERFSKHLASLITYGYIKVEQTKGKGSNRFARNLYTLLDRVGPCACAPCCKKQDTESKKIEKTPPEPCLCFPDTGNTPTKSNSIKNNNNINIYPSLAQKPIEDNYVEKKKSDQKQIPKVKDLESEFKTIWIHIQTKKAKPKLFLNT